MATQATASASMGPSEKGPRSTAFAAPAVRSCPRKTTPSTLVKQASASPPISASPAAATLATRSAVAASPLRNRAWKTSHSLTKPLSGGRPTIAAEPTRNAAAVSGIRRPRPPSRSSARVPVARTTAPAPMRRRLVNSAWFSVCSTAPVNPSTPTTGRP
jgi:hypothetical protein